MIALSIIIPVLNEAETISDQLRQLRSHIAQLPCEVIVVDGGSSDKTVDLSTPYADRVVISQTRGRAAQMNTGAALARGNILLFLHADTNLPKTAIDKLCDESKRTIWGFFPLKLSGKKAIFRVIERAINIRSRISSVATGDQCLFISRVLFEELSGYANIPLMEDVELSKRLRKCMSPVVMPVLVTTSSRRWEERGVFKTIFLMWRLRLYYFLGVSPHRLAEQY